MLLTLARTAGVYGVATAMVAVRRTAIRVSLYLAVLVLGLAGIGFLSAAAFMALSEGVGRIYAALIVGCAFLVAALIVLLIAQMRRR